jgi:hypothetical protein
MAVTRRQPVVADRVVRPAVRPTPAVPTPVRAAAAPATAARPAPAVPTPVRAATSAPARNVMGQTTTMQNASTRPTGDVGKMAVCGPGTARAGLAPDATKYADGGCGALKQDNNPPNPCPAGQTRNAAGKCVPVQQNAGKTGLNLAGLGLDQNTINQLLNLYGKNTQYNPISSLLNAITNQKEYELAKAKQDAELAATTAATTRAQTGATTQLAALQDLLGNTAVPESIATAIGEYGKNASEATAQQYVNLVNTLNDLYYGQGGSVEAPSATSALGMTNAGFAALREYLAENPANAYALASQRVGTPAPVAVNDLAQYMAGQGVSQEGVTPTVQALNAAAQGGAENYQNLLNTLAAQETAGTQSRAREIELANLLARTGLGAEYTRQRGALTNQQLAALAQITQTQAAQRLQAERDAEARRQAIQDAILKLQGTGYITGAA